MNQRGRMFCAALGIVATMATSALAHRGTDLKYSQPIGHLVDLSWPTNMMVWGEDIPSDVDWNKIMESPTLEPNWVIADDFRDPVDLPVLTVRWWGSYLGPVFQQSATGAPITIPPGPGVEDGYAISFFKDIPDPDGSRPEPAEFSKPGDLLATYVFPFDKIRIKPTDYVGWDQHPIFEYEADLQDAHLDHAVTPYADPNGFNQRPGEIYWISIIAEVGHKLELQTDPATGEVRWVSEDTGKFADQHYWGWHTSPLERLDIATMGKLFMPGNQWQYGGWMPIQPQHGQFDMAFELLTVPEPTCVALALVATAIGLGYFRRSRK